MYARSVYICFISYGCLIPLLLYRNAAVINGELQQLLNIISHISAKLDQITSADITEDGLTASFTEHDEGKSMELSESEKTAVEWLETATLACRVCRNMCVQNVEVQCMLSDGVVSLVKQHLLNLNLLSKGRGFGWESAVSKFNQMCAMMLGNWIAGNETTTAHAWLLMSENNGFFHLLTLSKDDIKLLDVTCMLLYNCIRNSSTRQKELACNVDIMRLLISRLVKGGGVSMDGRDIAALEDDDSIFQWCSLIFESLFAADLLPDVHSSLRLDDGVTAGNIVIWKMLLHILEENKGSHAAYKLTASTLTFIVAELQSLSPVYIRNRLNTNGTKTSILEDRVLVDEKVREEIIRLLLVILCEVTMKEDRCDNDVILNSDILPLLLQFFPSKLTNPDDIQTKSKVAALQASLRGGQVEDVSSIIRSLAMRLIANLSHKSNLCASKLMDLGGISVVLSQTGLDVSSPILREWSLFAVRNLCEGSEEVQEFIMSLEKYEQRPVEGISLV